jgi:type III pantothenate kinase
MLLALDIGNTETTVGLFQADRLVEHWRLTTTTARTPDEWGALLSTYLTNAGHSPSGVRAVVVASVAPLVTQNVCEGVAAITALTAVLIDGRSVLPITLDVDEPLTVGADRIVNTLAAVHLFERDTIVVDFGTATTFDCITADGRFIGGVIMPGIRTASDELVRRTAKLPATELTAPERVIGRRTEDCIRSGVIWGTVDAVDGLIRRIRNEWPAPGDVRPLVVATGGLATLVAPFTQEIETVQPDLTLVGLRLAAEALGLGW